MPNFKLIFECSDEFEADSKEQAIDIFIEQIECGIHGPVPMQIKCIEIEAR